MLDWSASRCRKFCLTCVADLDNLPDPDVLANEIIENIEAGLESFKKIKITLNGSSEESADVYNKLADAEAQIAKGK